MTDKFEENLGRNTYITLPQIKDYLSISSNTQDARLSNLVYYATGVIEHYIGQEILANDYVEIYDGGKSSVFSARLPLNNVYQVSEFNGVDFDILDDPTTIGAPVITDTDSVIFNFAGDARCTTKITKFGKSCLTLDNDDFIYSGTVPESMIFEDGDFTIEAFVRVTEATLQDNVVFSVSTDDSNYMKLSLANQYGLSFEANNSGSSTVVRGDNVSIETQQFVSRQWAHIAAVRDISDDTLKLFYNGNLIANSSYTINNHNFTSNVLIGETFKGQLDEIRVSSMPRYTQNFSVPEHRFRPDNDTSMLVHFDEKHNATIAKDVHAQPSEYSYSIDSGEITKNIGTKASYISVNKSYPSISLFGSPTFNPYPNGVKIEYNAGYSADSIPYDLQLATLDFIKLLYKQDQEKKGFSFEGEKGDSFPLAGNFPPHVRRILDLYRII
jgi:hypothetical protein